MTIKNLKDYLKNSYKVEIDHPELIKLNHSILDDLVDRSNKLEIIKRLFQYVRDKIQYECVKVLGALGTYERGTGACIDKSSLLIALLRINKIPARYITMRALLITKRPISETMVDHCAVEAHINGDWVILDPTFDPRFDHIFPKAVINSPNWYNLEKSAIYQTRSEISKLEMDITSKSYQKSSPWKKLISKIKMSED
jgi:hypothetical protein